MPTRTLTDHIESLNNIFKYEFYWSRKTKEEKRNFNKKHYINYLEYLKNTNYDK